MATPAKPKTVPCPICGKPSPWTPDNPWRPFCSERCKLIDLGEWISEDKRIPGEPAHPDEGSTPED
ncbi:DNA gyrase inhibitor YacG [Thiohalobacter sp. IOR34]|uniref:DNA gyrase inhibitor YacG n=1 Tax=Thiohalobacter sp. IOR34 TaxID=3057176 RepID=UPI0025B201AE|nr:DNA gyrase inhibitor YacG [Thiohalobacter sp. IOR34]WJW74938.1 DNA gyrase inhibitor YacG [Thiohalobacter sp. IOR34]